MHWFRDAQPPRSSILYVFRSPGGVSVGPEALEPERQLEIEKAYPDIDFQWKALVKNQQVVEVSTEPKWLRKRRRVKSPPSDGNQDSKSMPDRVARTRARPLPVPSALEGQTPEEQIVFLTEWYPRIRDRVLKRTSDPARQEGLLLLSERLNPGAWTDEDKIAAGLPRAAEALERLSKVFAKRKRSRRRAPKRVSEEREGSEMKEATSAKAPVLGSTDAV